MSIDYKTHWRKSGLKKDWGNLFLQIVNEHNRHNWWRNIAHVPQSIFLSDNSIKENIAFGVDNNQMKQSDVKYAAKLAQIDKIIDDLPEGYQTNVGERGVRLSGGQKQRIGIARALCYISSENRQQLKTEGFLIRDARAKERKKYGLRKARKAPQYSKR